MPSTIEQLNPTRVKLIVEIPFADLKPYLDKAYKEIAAQVNVPGFRKGKVPRHLIDQRFGRGVVLQEAINDALSPAYGAAIQEHKLQPLGQPEIEVTKLDDGELVEFTAELDVCPEFELPALEEITVEVGAAAATDDDLEERVNLLRKRFATTKEVARKAKKGDLLTIDLAASQGGKVLDDSTAEGIVYQLGEDTQMIDGMEKALTGVKTGDVVTFSSTLVGGRHRGEEAEIEVTVQKVEQEDLPDVDDEFAQLVSEFDTVEEMKDDLRRAVEAQAKQGQIVEARDKVVEALVAKTSFDLPEKFLADQIAARRENVEQQLGKAGLTVQKYLEESEQEEAETEEEFWAELEQQSEEALRAQLILDKYCKAHELSVSQQDLTEFLFYKAQMNGTSPQDEMSHMMEHGHMSEWMGEILRGKALAAICALATVKDAAGDVIEMPKPGAEQTQDNADEAELEGAQLVTEVDGEEIILQTEDDKQ